MFQNSVFVWIALATGAILLIPLIAMQFTSEVNWDETDFFIMGSLLFGMASLFVLAARTVSPRHRPFIGGMCVALFLYIWAELAVGVFTNLGG
ncbi:MAG: hypothetical protein KJO95_02375 [Gammaproteobacteria bacterium]|nr:hypothetical protein [Gammaproteobacteria bacterium]MBU2677887.1 hypothetical protein [Gammaproteobacteria bacterium]NNC56793.1 hypothetical protein [Woeseiaceae bacterium]NNL51619.1 hypothetical protein [Woeseiaceae bacterium]